MKKIFYIFIVAIFTFVTEQQAIAQKCNDKVVKDLAINIYRDHITKECKEYIDIVNEIKQIYGNDGLNIALLQNGMTSEMIEEMNKICKNIKTANITIEHVMTTNINKSINKYACTGTLKQNGYDDQKITYTCQPTDDRKHIYVELLDID